MGVIEDLCARQNQLKQIVASRYGGKWPNDLLNNYNALEQKKQEIMAKQDRQAAQQAWRAENLRHQAAQERIRHNVRK